MSDPRMRITRPLRRVRPFRHVSRDDVAPERSMAPTSSTHRTPALGALVDSAVYVAGHRTESAATPTDTYDMIGQNQDAMAWIGFYRPSESQLTSLAEQFGFHELAVEDAIVAHQRPKLERYGDTLFVVLRPARYLDDVEQVDFGELHVFVGGNFVVTVRHSETPDLALVRRRMECDPELLSRGPEAVLYAILDAVVDGYAPVVAGLQNDIDEIEAQSIPGRSPCVEADLRAVAR